MGYVDRTNRLISKAVGFKRTNQQLRKSFMTELCMCAYIQCIYTLYTHTHIHNSIHIKHIIAHSSQTAPHSSYIWFTLRRWWWWKYLFSLNQSLIYFAWSRVKVKPLANFTSRVRRKKTGSSNIRCDRITPWAHSFSSLPPSFLSSLGEVLQPSDSNYRLTEISCFRLRWEHKAPRALINLLFALFDCAHVQPEPQT